MDIMKMGKNPHYLGSWDLEDVPGNELTLTIKNIDEELVEGAEGRKEKCAICHFAEPGFKPMVLNLTNRKALSKLYKTTETTKLIGKRITIIVKQVKAFGAIHDALRIKPEIPATKAEPMEKCEICGGNIMPTTKMSSKQVAEYARSKFGVAICANCAKAKLAEIEEQKKTEEEAPANENNENND